MAQERETTRPTFTLHMRRVGRRLQRSIFAMATALGLIIVTVLGILANIQPQHLYENAKDFITGSVAPFVKHNPGGSIFIAIIGVIILGLLGIYVWDRILTALKNNYSERREIDRYVDALRKAVERVTLAGDEDLNLTDVFADLDLNQRDQRLASRLVPLSPIIGRRFGNSMQNTATGGLEAARQAAKELGDRAKDTSQDGSPPPKLDAGGLQHPPTQRQFGNSRIALGAQASAVTAKIDAIMKGKSKDSNQRIAILGAHGSGKTTLLKHHVLIQLRELRSSANIPDKLHPLPVYISMSDYQGSGDLKQYVLSQAASSSFGIVHTDRFYKTLQELMEKGLLIVYLDDWDRLSYPLRGRIATTLKIQCKTGRWIIGSRQEEYDNSAISGFTEYEIARMDENLQRDLAKRVMDALYGYEKATTSGNFLQQILAPLNVVKRNKERRASQSESNKRELAETISTFLQHIEVNRSFDWVNSPYFLTLAAWVQYRFNTLPESPLGMLRVVMRFALGSLPQDTFVHEETLQAMAALALRVQQRRGEQIVTREVIDVLGEVRDALKQGWTPAEMATRLTTSGLFQSVSVGAADFSQQKYEFKFKSFRHYLSSLELARQLAAKSPAIQEKARHLMQELRGMTRWDDTLQLVIGTLIEEFPEEHGAKIALKWLHDLHQEPLTDYGDLGLELAIASLREVEDLPIEWQAHNDINLVRNILTSWLDLYLAAARDGQSQQRDHLQQLAADIARIQLREHGTLLLQPIIERLLVEADNGDSRIRQAVLVVLRYFWTAENHISDLLLETLDDFNEDIQKVSAEAIGAHLADDQLINATTRPLEQQVHTQILQWVQDPSPAHANRRKAAIWVLGYFFGQLDGEDIKLNGDYKAVTGVLVQGQDYDVRNGALWALSQLLTKVKAAPSQRQEARRFIHEAVSDPSLPQQIYALQLLAGDGGFTDGTGKDADNGSIDVLVSLSQAPTDATVRIEALKSLGAMTNVPSDLAVQKTVYALLPALIDPDEDIKQVARDALLAFMQQQGNGDVPFAVTLAQPIFEALWGIVPQQESDVCITIAYLLPALREAKLQGQSLDTALKQVAFAEQNVNWRLTAIFGLQQIAQQQSVDTDMPDSSLTTTDLEKLAHDSEPLISTSAIIVLGSMEDSNERVISDTLKRNCYPQELLLMDMLAERHEEIPLDIVQRLLKRQDPATRRGALFAIGQMGASADLSALLAALKSHHAGEVTAAVNALVNLNTRPALMQMAELVNHPRPDIAADMIQILLQKAKDGVAADALLQALADAEQQRQADPWPLTKIQAGLAATNEDQRNAALQALREYGDRVPPDVLLSALAYPPIRDDIIRIIIARQDRDSLVTTGLRSHDPAIRASAVTMMDVSKDAVKTALIGMLRDHDAGVRLAVLQTLKTLDSEQIAQIPFTALATTFTDTSLEVRLTAIPLAGQSRDPAFKRELEALTRDQQVEIRVAAIAALGQSVDYHNAPLLLALLRDPDVDVRTAAMRALANAPQDVQLAQLTPSLQDASPAVRAATVDTISAIALAAAKPLLVPASHDSDATVRAAALRALARKEAGTSPEYFLPFLKDEAAAVREASVTALAQAAQPAYLQAIVAATEDADVGVQAAALHGLVPYGEALPLPVVEKKLLSDDFLVQLAALAALHVMPIATRVASLRQALQQAPNEFAAVFLAGDLGEIGEPAIPALTETLATSSSSIIPYFAAEELLEMGSVGVQALIQQSRQSQTPSGRYAAVTTLCGEKGIAVVRQQPPDIRTQFITTLFSLLDDEDADFRQAARDGLQSFGDDAASRFREALTTGSAQQRAAIITIIGATRDQRIAIVPYLHDDAALVRAATAMALGNMGTASATPHLQSALADAAWEVRTAAALALVLIGGEGQAIILRQLNDRDPDMRALAIWALGRELWLHDDGQLRQRLMASLRDLSAMVQMTALVMLSRVAAPQELEALASTMKPAMAAFVLICLKDRATATAPQLIQSAYQSPDPLMRQLAVIALGALTENDVALDRLTQCLFDRDETVAQAASEALIAQGSMAQRVVATYTEAHLPREKRMTAYRTLAKWASPPYQLLVQGLQDTDRLVQLVVLDSVTNIITASLLPGLLAAWRSPDSEVRTLAVMLMGRLHADAPRDIIDQALTDQDVHVRAAALRTLGMTNDERVLPRIADYLENPDATLRVAAIWGLGELHVTGAEGVKLLVKQLNRRDLTPDERREIILSLALLPSTAVAEQIVQRYQQDSDALVRVACVKLAVTLGNDAGLAIITQALMDRDQRVRDEALQAITQKGLKIPDEAKLAVCQSLFFALNSDDAQRRRDIVAALGTIGKGAIVAHEEVTQLLIAAVCDSDSYVRTNALQALQVIDHERWEQVLMDAEAILNGQKGTGILNGIHWCAIADCASGMSRVPLSVQDQMKPGLEHPYWEVQSRIIQGLDDIVSNGRPLRPVIVKQLKDLYRTTPSPLVRGALYRTLTDQIKQHEELQAPNE